MRVHLGIAFTSFWSDVNPYCHSCDGVCHHMMINVTKIESLVASSSVECMHHSTVCLSGVWFAINQSQPASLYLSLQPHRVFQCHVLVVRTRNSNRERWDCQKANRQPNLKFKFKSHFLSCCLPTYTPSQKFAFASNLSKLMQLHEPLYWSL